MDRSANMRAIGSKDMRPELAVRSLVPKLVHRLGYRHTPKSNPGYWEPKLERNRIRDMKNLTALDGSGWKALIHPGDIHDEADGLVP